MLKYKPVEMFLLLFLLMGCSSTEIKSVKDAKESYNYGLKLLEEDSYIQARETFQEIKNRLPDSRYATLAELRIADSYYDEESYPEAISSYEVFEDLHPGHCEREYVIFRIANSYFNDAPDAIDRDLEPLHKSYREFKRLLKLFPKTKYKNAALEKMKVCREKLVEKEYYIGYYYFKREIYKSCTSRYENIIKEYPDIKNKTSEKAMYELWVAYGKLNDKKNQKRIGMLFKKEFPKSNYSLK